MGQLDEGSLLRRAARGDRAAFEEFYRRTSPWLTVRLRRRCGDEQLVSEVLQETYLAVWRGAGAFAADAAGSSPLGWLWTVAGRRLVDAFRAQGRHQNVVRAVLRTAEEADSPSADEALLRSTVSGELGDALGALAPELRQVLQALVLDGLSVRETSALLGIPEGTVKTRARRARLAMREAIS
ncbi:RNA polymerase sigma factor [Amycolatopsis rhizosphaerae]|uniref:RNA polymerase sigma factor n=1 Tax=Amycolatopsis rhizosphaerae TaxID=2053003 RepID=A0A558BWB3_9PSEU|nr:RNA polymerase sigma factor [Amycolatopsis rhizosphaerae]TVT40794.1 RNA polymerase sigma factor [Amycolatopsis rhizosphaerae]